MKDISKYFALLLVALCFAGCGLFSIVDDDDPTTPTTPTQNQISFTFSTNVEVVEYTPYLHLRVFPSDKFTFYAWFVVPTEDLKGFSTKKDYVCDMLYDSITAGATYQNWKSELIVCCSDLQYDMPLRSNTQYTVVAFMISQNLLLIGDVYSTTFTTPKVTARIPDGYLDMGLPSGTCWYYNASGWYYQTYIEHVNMAPDQFAAMPTQVQWQELFDYCKVEWDGGGCQITSKKDNDMTFYLPAAGMYDGNGTKKYEDIYGCFWTSTHRGSIRTYVRIGSSGIYDFQEANTQNNNWRMSATYVWQQ